MVYKSFHLWRLWIQSWSSSNRKVAGSIPRLLWLHVEVYEWVNVTSGRSVDWISAIEKLVISKILKRTWVQDVVMLLNDVPALSIKWYFYLSFSVINKSHMWT